MTVSCELNGATVERKQPTARLLFLYHFFGQDRNHHHCHRRHHHRKIIYYPCCDRPSVTIGHVWATATRPDATRGRNDAGLLRKKANVSVNDGGVEQCFIRNALHCRTHRLLAAQSGTSRRSFNAQRYNPLPNCPFRFMEEMHHARRYALLLRQNRPP